MSWRIRGFVWFLLSGALFTNAPRLWTAWAERHSLFDLKATGLWGALGAVLLVNVIGYGWHRSELITSRPTAAPRWPAQ